MKRKIFDIENITLQERVILALAFILVLLFFTKVIQILFSDKNKFDYSKISGETVFEDAIELNDREVYWVLNDIIFTFINSYRLELPSLTRTQKKDIVYSRKDFYDVLSDEYREYISKSKYLKISKDMLDKFTLNNMEIKEDEFINEVRQLNNNEYPDYMYICKLNTLKPSTTSYIGIQLFPNTKNYNIFYLE